MCDSVIRTSILVEDEEAGIGIVIEKKYREDGKPEEGCREALKQIENPEYAARLEEDGINTIIKYGIACNRKKCKVMKGSRAGKKNLPALYIFWYTTLMGFGRPYTGERIFPFFCVTCYMIGLHAAQGKENITVREYDRDGGNRV